MMIVRMRKKPASWDVPTISGGARLLGESIMTCNKDSRRTVNLEHILDIDEKGLSSKNEGLEMLSFAARGQGGIFAICNIRSIVTFNA